MPDIKTFDIISRKDGETAVQDIKVEAKCDIPSESVYRILSVNGDVVITERNFENGKYRYSGKVNFFICYLDSEKNLMRHECDTEFSNEIDVVDNPKLFTTATVERTEVDLSGIKLLLKGDIRVKTDIVYSVKTACFDFADGIITKKEQREVSSYNRAYGTYALEEELSFPFALKEVLCQKLKPIVKSVSVGVGLINVEGEAVLSIIALQSGEKRDIIREEKVFPFRAEVEADYVMPTDSVYLSVSKKSFKTDVFVDENSGKTDVNISATLIFEGETESRENVDICVDAFSLTDHTREERRELKYAHINGEYSETVNVFGAIDFGEDGEEKEYTVINSYAQTLSIEEDTLSGIYGVNILVNSESGLSSKKAEVPFTYKLKENEKVLSLTAIKPQVSFSDKLEIRGEVVVTVVSFSPYSVLALTDVITVGEKKKESSAISVHIAKANEELWDISKRLSVSPESLKNSNKELEFPLTGKERIVVYRQL